MDTTTRCTRLLFLTLVAALSITSCNDDVSGPRIAIHGTVVDILTGDPLVGAEICIELERARTRCQTSDPSGEVYFTDVPGERYATWTLTAERYVSVMEHMRLGAEDLDILADSVRWTFLRLQGALYDVEQQPDLAGIGLVVVEEHAGGGLTRLAGVEFEIAGAMLDGPYYITESLTVDPASLVRTGTMGAATYFNVPVGTYEVTARAEGYDCAPHELLAWPGSTPDASVVDTRTGTATYSSFVCTRR